MLQEPPKNSQPPRAVRSWRLRAQDPRGGAPSLQLALCSAVHAPSAPAHRARVPAGTRTCGSTHRRRHRLVPPPPVQRAARQVRGPWSVYCTARLRADLVRTVHVLQVSPSNRRVLDSY